MNLEISTVESQVCESSNFFLSTEIFNYIDQFHKWRYWNIIMDNQVLRAINHIKYVSKKKPSTLKILNYLQYNGASNYYYKSLENEIAELRNKGIIDEIFKITNPIEEVLNFPEDDVDITSENPDVSCLNTQSSQVDEENDATPSLNNNTLTPNPQAVFPSDFEILFQSLEDKLNGKISAIKSYLLDEVYDLT